MVRIRILLDQWLLKYTQWRSFNQNFDNTEVRPNQQTNEWQDNNYTPLTIKDGGMYGLHFHVLPKRKWTHIKVVKVFNQTYITCVQLSQRILGFDLFKNSNE